MKNVMELTTGNPDVPKAKVQLLGAIGAGKSSVINSLDSVLSNRISNTVSTDISDQSVTTEVCGAI